MGRAPCCDKAKVKKGPWSPEEDLKLKDFIEKFGTGGNWIALPQKVGLRRCGKSCRLRWLNYLRPNIKHGDFSEEEDRIICSLFASIGSRWSIIASQLPGRTDNDIKNYWNTRLKKKLLAVIPTPLSQQHRKPLPPSPFKDSIFMNPSDSHREEPIIYPYSHHHLPNNDINTNSFIDNFQAQKESNFVDPLEYYTFENSHHQTLASCRSNTSNSDVSCSQISYVNFQETAQKFFQNFNHGGSVVNHQNQWCNDLDLQEKHNGFGFMSPNNTNNNLQFGFYLDPDLDIEKGKQQMMISTFNIACDDNNKTDQEKVMYYYQPASNKVLEP